MKYIISLLVFLLVSVFSFSFIGNTYSAGSIFTGKSSEIPYDGDEYGLEEGIKAIKDIDGFTDEKDASTYAQKIVIYLLGFIYLISVALVIYAGFNLLTGVGDEEKAKKSKIMITYVIIGITIIFLAGPIVKFITSALSK